MPISIAQAAGLAAVVGAAGFGAMTYLSSPSTDNNAFIPPSVYEQQGNVQYVAQSAGGGQYTSNGEVKSAFLATQSDSIRLANQQFERENQARALEDADVQPIYAEENGSAQMPKAYQMGQTDLGLGMGSTGDKQQNGSLEMFSQLQKQLSGIGDVVNNAQAKAAAAQQGGAQAGAASGTSGQTAAQLSNAQHNWGQGGLTRAGSGGGIDNSFALQNSGKNQGAEAAAAMAQMGNVMADARASLEKMQEGARVRSRANFGPSDGLGSDRNLSGQRERRLSTKERDELRFIHKQTAEIAKNKTNTATAGMDPFLSSAKLSGGITVDGNVTTGQGASSSDLNNADKQIKGVHAGLAGTQANMDERELVRDNLKHFLLTEFMVALTAMFGISVLVRLAKAASGPWAAFFWAAAGVLTALTLLYIWYGTIKYVTDYNGTCGSDGWTLLGWGMATLLTAGVGVVWYWSAEKASKITKATLTQVLLPIIGFGGAGFGLFDIMKKK